MGVREEGLSVVADRGMAFTQFDVESFKATKEAWLEDVSKGEGFAPDVEQLMSWAEKHLDLIENEIAYGIFHENNPVAVGICELAITKPDQRGKWVKLIRLRLRPMIEGQIFANDPDALTIAVDAYIASALGVYHVKNEHEATTIKVYGRTQEQMRFLTVLAAALKLRDDATFNTRIDGRWLVLNWGKL